MHCVSSSQFLKKENNILFVSWQRNQRPLKLKGTLGTITLRLGVGNCSSMVLQNQRSTEPKFQQVHRPAQGFAGACGKQISEVGRNNETALSKHAWEEERVLL
jgi:hypothetical protein